MIPALGAGGREFDSRITPFVLLILQESRPQQLKKNSILTTPQHLKETYKKMMQSVGIEPTLLRTRALSVRLNRSAKTASLGTRTIHEDNLHNAM